MGIRNYILNRRLGILIKNKKFSELTTMKVGGKINNLFYPQTLENLIEVVNYLDKRKKSYLILGNGSNIIASDKTYKNLVICGKHLVRQIEFHSDHFIVSGFMDLRVLVGKLIESNINTLTLLAGIPATIGGAIYMNAGANNYNISDDLLWVKFYYEGKIIKANKTELSFGYRDSFFKGKNIIILEAAFILKKDENAVDIYKQTLRRRKEIQPLNYPNSGSIFRNNDNIKAYQVIKDIGLVDLMMGGAKFSEKHANFIVNVNKAKAKDVFNLIQYAKEKAKKILQIELKEEVILLNFREKHVVFMREKNKK